MKKERKETANILSLMLQQTSSITFSELFFHIHSGTATNEYVTKGIINWQYIQREINRGSVYVLMLRAAVSVM